MQTMNMPKTTSRQFITKLFMDSAMLHLASGNHSANVTLDITPNNVFVLIAHSTPALSAIAAVFAMILLSDFTRPTARIPTVTICKNKMTLS